MTHTYQISGMTCGGCMAKVQSLLENVAQVTTVAIDLPSGTAAITMDRHVPTSELQAAFKDYPQYSIREQAA